MNTFCFKLFLQKTSVLNLLKKSFIVPGLFLFLLSEQVIAQRFAGYTDRFDNGTLEFNFRGNAINRPPFVIWDTKTHKTLQLKEEEGVLKINYTRKEGTAVFDHFTFHPFRGINVENNPRIQLDVKSDVKTTLTVSPTYSMEPPTFEFLEQEIPGDNQWHTYTFELTNPWFENKRIEAVDFYFDRGNSEEKSAHIDIDNFRMAWYLIEVSNLSASVSEGKNVQLSWKTSNAERTVGYKVYRGKKSGFTIDDSNQVAEVKTTS